MKNLQGFNESEDGCIEGVKLKPSGSFCAYNSCHYRIMKHKVQTKAQQTEQLIPHSDD